MDKITEMVSLQLQGLQDVESLQIQNHIYGCFVLMEDITEKKITLEGYRFKGTYPFDLDRQFSQIGIRYGFVTDTKLIADCLPAYKETWLQVFTSALTLDDVDRIEDGIIDIIKMSVEPKMAFFLHALETGSLPQEWLSRMIELVMPSVKETVTPTVSETASPSAAAETVETTGSVEKDMTVTIEKPKKFRTTKRHPIVVTKFLGKTRRMKR